MLKYTEKLIKENWQLILTLVFIIAFGFIIGFGCPILYLIGIPCLGCGMTRATVSLLRLDFVSAFQYHPMVFVLPVVAISYIYLKMKKMNTSYLVYCMFICFVITYIIRALFLNDPVLNINIKNGLLYKLYNSFLEAGRKLW